MLKTVAPTPSTATKRHLTTAQAHAGIPVVRPLGVPQVQMSLHFLSGALDQDVGLTDAESLAGTARSKVRAAGYLLELRDLIESGAHEQVMRHLTWAIETLNDEALAARKESEG